MRVSSITKNAGKACNNRLYRHIRTFEKIVKNYFVISTKYDSIYPRGKEVTALTYSIEESALISGLIVEYFSRASVSEPLRLAYRQVHRHLMDNHLTQDDLKRIQAALDFLLPVFPPEREAQKTFRAAILKTKAMLKSGA